MPEPTTPTPAAPAPAGLQERIEAHPVGRALVVAANALVLATLALNNLPDSPLREQLSGAVAPVERHTGLGQDWKLFAPDPSPVGVELVAVVQRADGTTGTWRPPVGGDAPFTAYRGFRWRKWASALARTENPLVLAAAARYVAAQDDGAPAVAVVFYRVGLGEHASLEPRFLGRATVEEPGAGPAAGPAAGAAADERTGGGS